MQRRALRRHSSRSRIFFWVSSVGSFEYAHIAAYMVVWARQQNCKYAKKSIRKERIMLVIKTINKLRLRLITKLMIFYSAGNSFVTYFFCGHRIAFHAFFQFFLLFDAVCGFKSFKEKLNSFSLRIKSALRGTITVIPGGVYSFDFIQVWFNCFFIINENSVKNHPLSKVFVGLSVYGNNQDNNNDKQRKLRGIYPCGRFNLQIAKTQGII